jgi:hypothetical protein
MLGRCTLWQPHDETVFFHVCDWWACDWPLIGVTRRPPPASITSTFGMFPVTITDYSEQGCANGPD